MRSPSSWFVALALVCIAGPYVLGVRPRTVRERRYVAVAIAFLAWVLLLMAPLRSMSGQARPCVSTGTLEPLAAIAKKHVS